jgi:ubiquinone/menaquinone biosynthesis C-methylase UbiE
MYRNSDPERTIMITVLDCYPPAGAAPAPDLKALKARQQAAWSSGDYAIIGTTLQIVGENLAESMDLRAGQTVLDVAAGNGNATLAAARRWCEVTSTDYVEQLLASARKRAEAEGLQVQFEIADAENLPFADASFDAVVSTFGAMFSADQDRTAAELIRVTKPGGRIGLANWTPEGFIGELFKIVGKHLPPPAGVKSPTLWGTQTWLNSTFGAAASAIATEPRHFNFRYRSAQHFLGLFREYYGPVLKAFEHLKEPGRKALAEDIVELVAKYNVSGNATMVVPGEYLEVVVTKR